MTLEERQRKALDLGFKYWRAPDAHGVTCTPEQAVEFMQEMLGVEVEIKTDTVWASCSPWLMSPRKHLPPLVSRHRG